MRKFIGVGTIMSLNNIQMVKNSVQASFINEYELFRVIWPFAISYTILHLALAYLFQFTVPCNGPWLSHFGWCYPQIVKIWFWSFTDEIILWYWFYKFICLDMTNSFFKLINMVRLVGCNCKIIIKRGLVIFCV